MPHDREVTTERLYLTPFAPAHAEALFAMNSDPEVMRYLGPPQTRADVEASIAKVRARWDALGYGWWAIFLKGTDTLIGSACVQNLAHKEDAPLEIGWRLMDFGFERLGVDYLCAVADLDNTPSQKVMQRLGMSYVGVQTHYDIPSVVYEKHRHARGAEVPV